MKSQFNKKIFIILCLTFSCTLFSTKLTEIKTFLINAYQNFTTVGAVAPFSNSTAKKIMNSIKNIIKSKKAKKECFRFLEVGAGTGALSEYFIKKFNIFDIDYEIDLVELNEEFCEILKNKFKNNSRVNIHCTDILKWKSKNKYDVVVSTLPFNSNYFTNQKVKTLLEKFEQIINPTGLLFYVEYILIGNINKLFLNKKNKKAYEEKHSTLKAFRKKHITKRLTVFLNIPPTYVYEIKINKN